MIHNREKQQQGQELAEKVKENIELYKRVFDNPDGKKVLEDLAKRCFAYSTTYSDVSSRMAFNEGRRSVFTHIKGLVDKDLETVLAELKGVKR